MSRELETESRWSDWPRKNLANHRRAVIDANREAGEQEQRILAQEAARVKWPKSEHVMRQIPLDEDEL